MLFYNTLQSTNFDSLILEQVYNIRRISRNIVPDLEFSSCLIKLRNRFTQNDVKVVVGSSPVAVT